MEDKYSEDPKLITPLVVSLLIPIVGGLYEYFKFKDSNPHISEIFKYGTFAIPIGIVVNQALSLANLSNYWISIAALFGTALIIKKLALKKNKYADIIWIYYTGLLGLIYAYYFKYDQDQGIRYLIYHFAFRTVAYSIIIGLLLGVVLILFSGFLMNMGIDTGAILGL